ncbi:hypothetical protein F9B77_10740 [Staphylococcus epidermidis]|uniref:Uncharacterized protein n=3 Tax=Staphylococcus epidermidis TaxID=1282 RepID=Q5HMX9_STAEQ|nr:hypothetical protein SE_1641 [Staphylococcus epidermidis ATCC 12228]AAW54827.1 hypothetical protein SERP1496 [Staphylococcus epidermidis RP62A]ARG66193.1 hypothetical protein B4U56_04260 [Staphylococcus epidermidis]MBA9874062.1 hypothetical protein [Ralstonia insidiosa]AVA10278.1 hypothetical protein AL514_01155 [Staphylococcus epidermidis]
MHRNLVLVKMEPIPHIMIIANQIGIIIEKA